MTQPKPTYWCRWHQALMPCVVTDGHCDPMRGLSVSDEPDQPGAVAAVWFGDYRRQEIWVSSGANMGNWYCLGGEFGRPRTWVDRRSALDQMTRNGPYRPGEDGPGPGEIPQHPNWNHVLDRGPVTLLTTDHQAYALGWANGVRAVRHRIDTELEMLETEPEAAP